MTTTEKLERIKSKCEQLLAIAEKRTKGEWAANPETLSNGNPFNTIYNESYVFVCHTCATKQVHEDAAFIAACAGPAEAGWRATIAAVDEILPYLLESDAAPGAVNSGSKFMLTQRAKTILAAWPEELL